MKNISAVKSPGLFFPNLNGLRFIAAFAVIIHHMEQTKFLTGIPNSFMKPAVLLLGSLGVTLFFVLSGFLITYLLIAEKEKSGTINIRNFYIRRILRIWPLYYLVIIAGLFIFPFITFFEFPVWSIDLFSGYEKKIILFMLILPNVALIQFPPMPYMKQAWSVGVEEQFYLIWPWVIKYSKNYLKPLLIIVLAFMVITAFLFWISNRVVLQNSSILPVLNFLKQYFLSFRVGCMGIGGIGAYLVYFKKEKILSFFFSRIFQFILYGVLIFFLAAGITVRYIQNEFYSCLFALVIINLASNPLSILSLSSNFFEYLGKISYGIYMFHPIAIMISFRIIYWLSGTNSGTIQNILQYILTLIITVVIAAISYKYFETYFLKFKHRFSPS